MAVNAARRPARRRRPLRWRLPRGLQWRLATWVAAVMLISAGVVFAVVYQETGSQLRTQIDQDISGDTADLAAALKGVRQPTPATLVSAARTYVRSQGYPAASRLIFVAVPGQATVSNHPEVFGEGEPERGESATRQAGENRAGRSLLAVAPGFAVRQLPDSGSVRMYVRALALGPSTVLLGAGESLDVVERAQHSVAKTFLLAGALVLLLALIASYLAGSRVSAPLREMAIVAGRVDAGELGPRMRPDASQANEVQVLAESFNHMLDRLAAAFAGQREFVADASHELRTPLTVIRGQLEVLAAQEHPTSEEIVRVERLVQAEIGRVSRLVDDMLLLAQAERDDFLRPQTIELGPFVTDIWEGATLTAERDFQLGALPGGTLTADPDRLAQALRNLAGNAIAHTEPGRGLVRLELHPEGDGRVRFSVRDDGPGIPAAERERVFERFHRTDASRSRSVGGAGLGLAIVRAIAEAHGGHARATAPASGAGAQVELILPGYRPEPR